MPDNKPHSKSNNRHRQSLPDEKRNSTVSVKKPKTCSTGEPRQRAADQQPPGQCHGPPRLQRQNLSRVAPNVPELSGDGGAADGVRCSAMLGVTC